jgi:hypothetical protein
VALSHRENYLRTADLSPGSPPPEHVPIAIVISGATWDQLRADLEDVLARHPVLFPNFQKGARDYTRRDFGPASNVGDRQTDAWGCLWRAEIDGIRGQVVGHPLDDWSKLTHYQPPDPLKTSTWDAIDWPQRRRRVEQARERDDLTAGGLDHGFLLMRLYYLRGFERLMLDFAVRDPRLTQLIGLVNGYNRAIVEQWLDIGLDVVHFPEDLGTQTASVLGPKHFADHIAPAYRELMQPVRAAGAHVHMHSDGYIMDIADQLIGCGVTILNPQDLCNGIDAIARELKGRVCIDLDIDRQSVVPFGTAKDIDDLIEEEVRKLGSPQGGLMMTVGIYPPTPAENVDALLAAFEKFRTYWWD